MVLLANASSKDTLKKPLGACLNHPMIGMALGMLLEQIAPFAADLAKL